MTLPSPPIEIRLKFDTPFAVVFDLKEPFPFRTQLIRERIRQTERDELDKAGLIAVGKITVLVPTQKPALNLVFYKGTRPRLFAFHNVAHARPEPRRPRRPPRPAPLPGAGGV